MPEERFRTEEFRVNGEELIALWQELYEKMPDEDKNQLPLHPVYFLGSGD